MDKIEIILPEGALTSYKHGDPLFNFLRGLTRQLTLNKPEEQAFGLGGEFGYGTNFENDTFLMHRFCWCEKDACAWCAGCTCPETAFHYLIDGVEVSFDKWMKYYVDRVPNTSNPDWEKIANEVNKHRAEKHDEICDYCQGKGIYERFGVKGMGAPNFWHKPSNFMVWWYKWIGRDMEIRNPNNISLKDIIKDVNQSLKLV